MRITFLGTGAAEAYPALFCNCKNCERARKLGGRNLRCRSSALVNDDLLVDFGPDTPAQSVRYNADLTKVENLLLTHSHVDHLFMHDVRHRKVSSRINGQLDMLTVWASTTSIEAFNEQARDVMMEEFGQDRKQAIRPTREEVIDELGDFLFMQTRVIEPHQSINIGRYKIHTIHAHHKEPEVCFNFIINDGKTRFLYGNDTGTWEAGEWDFIESLGITLDVVALDCTVGVKPGGGGHHSNESFLATHAEFVSRELLSPGARFFAHHFSHQWNFVHDDIVSLMAPHGVEVTYDGLVVEK
jgi:phosphoribosyl 1,2-cyclic phosphate phosphodiesterase